MEGNILLWDLETSPNLNTLWGLFNTQKVIHYSTIQQERYILCGGVKQLGAKKGRPFKISDYPEFADDPTFDKWLVRDIMDALAPADAIIAHNGDRFDVKWLNARAVFWGFAPLPNIITIDTLKIAKNKFYFNSNRLDYLAKFLGVGEKAKVSQQWWVDAMKGCRKAIKNISDYNMVDVDVLEKVYLKLAPWDVSKLNQAVLSDSEEPVCPLCGSDHLHQRGFRYTRTGSYARYVCQDCGHWSQGTRTLRRAGVKSK